MYSFSFYFTSVHFHFSCVLLFIIYTTFCDTFSHEEVDIDKIGLLSIALLGELSWPDPCGPAYVRPPPIENPLPACFSFVNNGVRRSLPWFMQDLEFVSVLFAAHALFVNEIFVVFLFLYLSQFPRMATEIVREGVLLFAVVLVQVCLMVLTFYLALRPMWNFRPSDIVAAFFCSTHKSLTLGKCPPNRLLLFRGNQLNCGT